ncbi:MAG: autotransporter-associated beta strand repeat-containing protein [Chthoniobacterales bacterium]
MKLPNLKPAVRRQLNLRPLLKYGSLLTALAFFAGNADAQLLYWDANGSTAGSGSAPAGTWGSNAYWNTDSTGGAGTFSTATTSSNDLYFSAGPSATSGNAVYAVTVSGTQSANSLNFQSSATGPNNANAGTTLNGGTINLGAGGITAPQYAYGTTPRGNVRINSAIALQASSTFFSDNVNAIRALWVMGNISDGAGSYGITKTGAGELHIGGNNSFDGGVTLDTGRLVLRGSANAAGTGTLTINGGSLSIDNTITLANNQQTWAGDFTVQTYGGTQNVGNGTVTLTGNRAVNVDASQNFIVGGTITDLGNAYNLTKNGTGTMTLGGINAYTGNTTVNAGTLVLSDNANLIFDIASSGVNNQINGTGTLTLDGDFSFDLSGAGTGLGDSWNIVTVGTLTESFGATFMVQDFTEVISGIWERDFGGTIYQFDKSTGILSVTGVIPEPSSFLLLTTGLATVLLRRRRQS